ncbi:MAG: hypothetical protein M1331_01735 [Candidatus Marsarchaeota archaeon]|nr:hypothetical protein [Candidatus Marsarchaeota archaeon]MCL5106100.1 hypothetical protein [Candidatus Marsarchaeota archaeon]
MNETKISNGFDKIHEKRRGCSNAADLFRLARRNRVANSRSSNRQVKGGTESSQKNEQGLTQDTVKFPITKDVLLSVGGFLAQMRLNKINADKEENAKISISEIAEYIEKYKPYEEGILKPAGASLKGLYYLERDKESTKYEMQPPKYMQKKYELVLKKLIHG